MIQPDFLVYQGVIPLQALYFQAQPLIPPPSDRLESSICSGQSIRLIIFRFPLHPDLRPLVPLPIETGSASISFICQSDLAPLATAILYTTVTATIPYTLLFLPRIPRLFFHYRPVRASPSLPIVGPMLRS